MSPFPGPQRPDGEALRKQVRARIVTGALPAAGPTRVFGGYGKNQTRDVCIQPISPTQVLYEVEFTSGQKGRRLLHFHLVCHTAWQLEGSR